MAITYVVDDFSSVVLVHSLGKISAKDIADHWALLLADKAAVVCGKILVDVRGSDVQLTESELWHLVMTILEPAMQGRRWKMAILVRETDQYCMLRQLQVFTDEYCENAIFTDDSTALEWIEEGRL